MLKNLVKIVALSVVALAITGCTNKIDGIIVPGDSYIEQNASTKLYYEDTNNAVIKEDLKNLADFLNTSKISPDMLVVSKSTSESDNIEDFESELVKNNGKTVDLKFSIDSNSNYIVVNKKYNSRNEAYLDIKQVWQFIAEQTQLNPDLRDKFGSGGKIYYLDEKALNDGKLTFTTKREIVRFLLAEKTYKAFALSGYKMINNPKDADKIVYFQLSRDYPTDELQLLKKEGKNINLPILNSGLNQSSIAQSSMNFASRSNSSGASVGIGMGAGLVVGLVANMIIDPYEPNFIIPAFKITNVKEKKDYLLEVEKFGYIHTNFYNKEFDKKRLYFPEEQRNRYEHILKIHNEGKSTQKGIPLN